LHTGLQFLETGLLLAPRVCEAKADDCFALVRLGTRICFNLFFLILQKYRTAPESITLVLTKKIECARGAPRPPCAPPRVIAGLDRISDYRALALSACSARLARPIPRPLALVQLVRPRAYCSAPTGREGRGSRPPHRLVRFQRPSPQNLHMFL
jgi:hypothetical protein